jgi:hypothetical protein
MSLLTKPSELTTVQTFKGLLYGQPGSGKTTLALSAPNPVCIDLDRGMHRVQPQFRVASLQVNTYNEVLALIESDEINPYETIVCDTLGKLIDRMCDYVAAKNPKARQADGQMTMKGWGEVKATFHAFFKLLASKNKSLLFVAHESEEKSGDDTIKRPDCAGSARKDIVKELDFMGYVEMIGGKRVINFNPSDKFYAKNSLDLPQGIEIPNPERNGNTFIAKQIVELSRTRAVNQVELREKYEAIVGLIESNIAELKNAAEVNGYYADMGKKEVIWDSALLEKRLLAERIATINVEFDKATKLFVDKKGTSKKSEKAA